MLTGIQHHMLLVDIFLLKAFVIDLFVNAPCHGRDAIHRVSTMTGCMTRQE